jgi:hypothetical protein
MGISGGAGSPRVYVRLMLAGVKVKAGCTVPIGETLSV